jgi:Tol biopolymer transport system component
LLFEAAKGPAVSLWIWSAADKRVLRFGELQSSAAINASFSPDGRGVAYSQLPTPSAGLFVQPFPPTGAKYQLPGGGIYPMWSPDGKRLFFNPAGRFLAVSVSAQPTLAFGNPVALARGTFFVPGPFAPRNHDIARDGQRLVGVISTATSGSSGQPQAGRLPPEQIQVVVNWFDELKTKLPAGK